MVKILEKQDEALGLEIKAKLEGGKIILEASADVAKLIDVADKKIDAGAADPVVTMVLGLLAGAIKAA
jgi:hypothetical protein